MARTRLNPVRRASPPAIRRRGLATIEMALVLPLLLTVVIGIIEYGWMFIKAQQVTMAAYAGARAGALADGDAADAAAAITQRMTQSGMAQDESGYTVAMAPDDPASLGRGGAFTVEVSVPYANVGVLGVGFIPTPETLVGRATIAREGP